MKFKLRSVVRPGFWLIGLVVALFAVPVYAQQTDPNVVVVVQPGAPGQPTRVLPSSTRPVMPLLSRKDIEFMQGMIMHHQQASR
jgi:uncharacterized protein (DUF305 family)